MGINVMRLKELRIAKGYNQEKLAAALNVSRSTVAMWETRKNNIDDDMLARLADLLGCTTDYLLGRSGIPQAVTSIAAQQAREELADDPDRKALLNLARYGSAQDVKQVAALIDALRATNPDFYDGDDPA